MRLRDAVYARAAADSDAGDPGSLAALLAGGLAFGLLGSTTGPPPPARDAPWAYLSFDVGAQAFVPNAVDGLLRWWCYDDEHQGYGRLDAICGRLLRLYPEQTGALFADDLTGELIYWLGMGFLGPDTLAREYDGMLLRWVNVPFRKTHLGVG
jgi:hypothetical protein